MCVWGGGGGGGGGISGRWRAGKSPFLKQGGAYQQKLTVQKYPPLKQAGSLSAEVNGTGSTLRWSKGGAYQRKLTVQEVPSAEAREPFF